MLAATGEPNDRGWAYVGLGVGQMDTASPAEQEHTFQQAEPYGAAVAAGNLASVEKTFWDGRNGRWPRYRKTETLFRDGAGGLDPPQIPIFSKQIAAYEQSLLGDHHAAAQAMIAVIAGNIRMVASPSYALAHFQLLEHDVAGARNTIAHPAPGRGSNNPGVQLQGAPECADAPGAGNEGLENGSCRGAGFASSLPEISPA